jgi:enoyl-CoA hydratase/carnithine racemase
MQFDTIEVAVDGERGALTLDRPDKLNPLSSHTLGEIEAAARWFDGFDDLKVVVVSGRGRAFSAGADVSSFGAPAAAGGAARSPRDDGDSGWRMARAMDEMRAVTVAKVRGWCVGGGLVLAGVCDLRVAARSARFSIPEVELGIPLAWGGIPRLVREIGPAMTKELVMTCRRFTAAEAKQLGFVNRVVAAGDVEAEAESLARDVASKPSVPVVITKEHVNAVTRAMTAGTTSFADGDALLGAAQDPESLESMRDYVTTRLGKKR